MPHKQLSQVVRASRSPVLDRTEKSVRTALLRTSGRESLESFCRELKSDCSKSSCRSLEQPRQGTRGPQGGLKESSSRVNSRPEQQSHLHLLRLGNALRIICDGLPIQRFVDRVF